MTQITTTHIESPDNIPFDAAQRDTIIKHAQEDFCAHRLLISGRLLEIIDGLMNVNEEYLRAAQKDPFGVCYELDEPDYYGHSTTEERVSSVELWKSRRTDDSHNFDVPSHYKLTRDQLSTNVICRKFSKINEELFRQYPNFADFLAKGVKGMVPRSFRRICEFPDLPFAAIPMDSKTMKQTVFLKEFENMKKVPGKTEAFSIHETLKSIVLGNTLSVPSERQCKLYQGNLRMLYAYKNKYGEIEMFECILWDLDEGCSVHIPITLYQKSGSRELYSFAMPLPKKQILYNLDLIEQAAPLKAVVICDSVDIAEANQANAPVGVVYTSWICDTGHLEEVDQSPLLKAEIIVFLIVNHAKKSLAEQYIATEDLVKALHEVKGFESHPFKFVQAEYEYPDYRIPYDLESFLNTYHQTRGTLIEGSEMEMDETKFGSMVVKARKSLLAPKAYFWQTDDQRDEGNDSEIKHETKTQQFIIHPWVQKGEITGLYGKKNHGKSPLAYTLAIAATHYSEKGHVDLFPERTICVVPDPVYRSHKVLLLDFELGQVEINRKRESIGGVYWPDKIKQKEAYQRSKENLIVVNMQSKDYQDYYGKDLSRPEYHQFLFDEIEKAKDKGIKGQPVDMIIIDTYNKFVGTESIKTNTQMTLLTRALRSMGIAVVITGQLNAEENPRGFQQKMDDEYATVVLTRADDKQTHSLTDTVHSIYLKNYRGVLSEQQLEPLDFTYPMNEKLVFCDNTGKSSQELADESLKGFVKQYWRSDYSYEDIAGMLGMKVKTLYELVPKSSLKK